MNPAIPAVYDSGVFRPLEPVDWPEGTRAEVIPCPAPTPAATGETDRPKTWPCGYFEQTAGALAGEDYERPPQGESPRRDAW